MIKNIDPFLLTMLGLILPGLLTGVGAIPVFFTRNVNQGKLDVFLGAAAGVMLSATCFSLILPSIEENGGGFRGVLISSLGILAGAVFLDLIDKYSPHEHLLDKRVEGNPSDSLKNMAICNCNYNSQFPRRYGNWSWLWWKFNSTRSSYRNRNWFTKYA